MAALQRLKLQQTPTDVWSIRERLCLASSVMRSGDQNWVSVSRAIKPYGEPNRPADWFAQKNCALQYSDLLEKVETPKRKRGERGEIETPGESIVRRLTLERIEELKKLIEQEHQQYKQLKEEIILVQSGHADGRLHEMWNEILEEKKKEEEAAINHQKWLQEREAANLAALAARRFEPKKIITKRPLAIGRHSSQPEAGNDLESGVESSLDDSLPADTFGEDASLQEVGISLSITTTTSTLSSGPHAITATTAATHVAAAVVSTPLSPTVSTIHHSPLLNTLLRSSSHASQPITPTAPKESPSLTSPRSQPSLTPPTISSLLSSTPGVHTSLPSSVANLLTTALSGPSVHENAGATPRPVTTTPSQGAPTLLRLLDMPLGKPGQLPPLPIVTTVESTVLSAPSLTVMAPSGIGRQLPNPVVEEVKGSSDLESRPLKSLVVPENPISDVAAHDAPTSRKTTEVQAVAEEAAIAAAIVEVMEEIASVGEDDVIDMKPDVRQLQQFLSSGQDSATDPVPVEDQIPKEPVQKSVEASTAGEPEVKSEKRMMSAVMTDDQRESTSQPAAGRKESHVETAAEFSKGEHNVGAESLAAKVPEPTDHAIPSEEQTDVIGGDSNPDVDVVSTMTTTAATVPTEETDDSLAEAKSEDDVIFDESMREAVAESYIKKRMSAASALEVTTAKVEDTEEDGEEEEEEDDDDEDDDDKEDALVIVENPKEMAKSKAHGSDRPGKRRIRKGRLSTRNQRSRTDRGRNMSAKSTPARKSPAAGAAAAAASTTKRSARHKREVSNDRLELEERSGRRRRDSTRRDKEAKRAEESVERRVNEEESESTSQMEDEGKEEFMGGRFPLLSTDSVPNSPASTSFSGDDLESVRDYKVWKKAIMLVWRSAATHKYANVFLHAVTEEMAPGYHSVVYRPMDLITVKKNVENGVIRTTAEFQRDVMLMFQNAIMYNNSDHDVFQMAIEMQKEVMGHIQDFLATQLMVQSAGAPKSLRRETREQSQKRSDSASDRSTPAGTHQQQENEKRKRPLSESEGASGGGKTKKRRTRADD